MAPLVECWPSMYHIKPGIVMHAIAPALGTVDAGGSTIQDCPQPHNKLNKTKTLVFLDTAVQVHFATNNRKYRDQWPNFSELQQLRQASLVYSGTFRDALSLGLPGFALASLRTSPLSLRCSFRRTRATTVGSSSTTAFLQASPIDTWLCLPGHQLAT